MLKYVFIPDRYHIPPSFMEIRPVVILLILFTNRLTNKRGCKHELLGRCKQIVDII